MAGPHAHLYRKNRWKLKSEAFRKANPLCVKCAEKGYITAAEVADHVTPHKGDEESFWSGELQALCKDCHDLKSTIEDASAGGTAQTHPDWLPTPNCKVVLVCGPPGAGKTTWAKAQATKADQVIDLDDCFTAVCGVHGHEAEHIHLTAALRYRNKLLAGLAGKGSGIAYVIVSAPTKAEREWWAAKLGAHVHLIDPGIQEVSQRLKGSRLAAAKQWYVKAKGQWRNPNRVVFNEDGAPVGGW